MVTEVTETESSAPFADQAHDGGTLTTVLNAVDLSEGATAHLGPVAATSGADTKAMLRRHGIDHAWSDEVKAQRGELTAEDRF